MHSSASTLYLHKYSMNKVTMNYFTYRFFSIYYRENLCFRTLIFKLGVTLCSKILNMGGNTCRMMNQPYYIKSCLPWCCKRLSLFDTHGQFRQQNKWETLFYVILKGRWLMQMSQLVDIKFLCIQYTELWRKCVRGLGWIWAQGMVTEANEVQCYRSELKRIENTRTEMVNWGRP